MNLIMPTLGYCCTEAQMETTNLYLQLPQRRENPQTCIFFICLNPPTAGSQQPPGALSPLVFFYVTLFTHSVEVYYDRAIYTNKPTILFFLCCAPYFSMSLLSLCL